MCARIAFHRRCFGVIGLAMAGEGDAVARSDRVVTIADLGPAVPAD